MIGFSIRSMNKVFDLLLVYPRLEYNLYSLLKLKRLQSIKDKVEFMANLAQVTHYLNSQGIINRNIKPTNILANERNDLFIADWEQDPEPTEPRMETDVSEQDPIYSYGYTAPEILSGGSGQTTQEKPHPGRVVGPQSTVWSLGIIFCQIAFPEDFSFLMKEKKQALYHGMSLKISLYHEGQDRYLDQLKRIIENMVKFDPGARSDLLYVINQLQIIRMQIEQDGRQDESILINYNNHTILDPQNVAQKAKQQDKREPCNHRELKTCQTCIKQL